MVDKIKSKGVLQKGQRVLVVEDLISTGGSSLKAVEVLRNEAANVIGCLAIFTYGFYKADQAFREALVKYHTLSNYDALIEQAIQSNYITADDMETLVQWRADIGKN